MKPKFKRGFRVKIINSNSVYFNLEAIILDEGYISEHPDYQYYHIIALLTDNDEIIFRASCCERSLELVCCNVEKGEKILNKVVL